MAVLRNGKITNINKNPIVKKRNAKNAKTKHLLKQHGIKHCVVKINRINMNQIDACPSNVSRARDVRSKNTSTKHDACNSNLIVNTKVNKKEIAIVSQSNAIWNQLISQQYTLGPGVIVLAKMNSYKPWPARINSVYKMGDIYKCYVLFFGTFQIGSVLRSSCVPVGNCDLYLLHAVRDIKKRYKWDIDYDKIAKTDDDTERAVALLKLTQNQKFLLAIRDIEHLNNIPYERSIIQSNIP